MALNINCMQILDNVTTVEKKFLPIAHSTAMVFSLYFSNWKQLQALLALHATF